jgi:polyisoprenyl-phosphate glycosyltransferase
VNPARKRLWLVSPVFFDVDAYVLLRARILEFLGARSPEFSGVRFVAIDDSGGLDDQVARLDACADVTVIAPPFNLGHQGALVYGLRALAGRVADDDWVVTLDADGEDRPEDLQRLLQPLLDEPQNTRKVVLARRTKRRETLVFKVMYLFFRILFRTLTGALIQTGNYAAYRGWLVRHVLKHPHFDMCYSSTFLSLGLSVTDVPCERGTRYAGESRMSYVKLIMHGLHMMMPFLDRVAIRALISFAALGGVTLAVGTVLAVARLANPGLLSGWAVYALLLVVLALALFAGHFVILFAVFAQSQSASLKALAHDPSVRLPE